MEKKPGDYFSNDNKGTYKCKLCGWSFYENPDIIGSSFKSPQEVIAERMSEHLSQKHFNVGSISGSL